MTYKWEERSKKSWEDDISVVADMDTDLISENLIKRLGSGIVFTRIGLSLVFVQPHKILKNLYGKELLSEHRSRAMDETSPHVYGLASKMLSDRLHCRQPQIAIPVGNSGSGKSEIFHRLAEALIEFTTSSEEAAQRFDHAHKILEAFGSAKAAQNQVATKCTNFVRIGANGVSFENLYLDTARVTSQTPGESNFHIFYQILKGLRSKERERLWIDSNSESAFRIFTKGFKVDSSYYRAAFQNTRRSFEELGLGDAFKDITKVLVSIMHLGNLRFKDIYGNLSFDDGVQFNFLSALLGVQPTDFLNAIGEAESAQEREESLNMLIEIVYTRLFRKVVDVLNANLSKGPVDGNFFGILDYPGFEVPQEDGGESHLRTNYLSEKIYEIYSAGALGDIVGTAVRENILADNSMAADAGEPPASFDGPGGVLEHVKSGGTQPVVSLSSRPFLAMTGKTLEVSHFNCVKVAYDMTRPNKYQSKAYLLARRLADLISSSSTIPFVSEFMSMATPMYENTLPDIKESIDRFRAEVLSKATLHFIPCIVPNDKQKALYGNTEIVKNQVDTFLLPQRISVHQIGLHYSVPHRDFLWYIGVPPSKKGRLKIQVINSIVSTGLDPANYTVGATRVFIHSTEAFENLRDAKLRKMFHATVAIRNAFRRHKRRMTKRQIDSMTREIFSRNKKRSRKSILLPYRVCKPSAKSCRKIQKELRGVPDYLSRVRLFHAKKKKAQFSRPRRYLAVLSKTLFLVRRSVVQQKKKKKDSGSVKTVYRITRSIPIAHVLSITLTPFADSFVKLKVTESHDLFIEDPCKVSLVSLITSIKPGIPVAFESTFEVVLRSRSLLVVARDTHTEAPTTLEYDGRILQVHSPAGIRNFPETEQLVIENAFINPTPNPFARDRKPLQIPVLPPDLELPKFPDDPWNFIGVLRHVPREYGSRPPNVPPRVPEIPFPRVPEDAWDELPNRPIAFPKLPSLKLMMVKKEVDCRIPGSPPNSEPPKTPADKWATLPNPPLPEKTAPRFRIPVSPPKEAPPKVPVDGKWDDIPNPPLEEDTPRGGTDGRSLSPSNPAAASRKPTSPTSNDAVATGSPYIPRRRRTRFTWNNGANFDISKLRGRL